ncbi:nicotinamide N-methyltransferase-like [Pyxicephalus adspersus]|uniref:nicotinamide N-methyltransferase-like n=1 Tax=Pyxicephalus adspersus TaxID=30357 RepID=UPI003B5AFC88
MEPSSASKFYHLHDFDHENFLQTFVSPTIDEMIFKEIIIFPMEIYPKIVKPGKTLIDCCLGPVISHLLPVVDYFSEIIILEPNDTSFRELQKWMDKDEGSLDSSQTSSFMAEWGVLRNNLKEKEESLRKKITSIAKFDLCKENPTEPYIAPKADCFICGYLLDHISHDKETYCKYMKKLASLIEPGGQLILAGMFDVKLCTIAEQKFHALSYDEEFLRQALAEAGFRIDYFKRMESNVQNQNIMQYGHVWIVGAIKEKEI